jgi:hypothetical protein
LPEIYFHIHDFAFKADNCTGMNMGKHRLSL